MIRAPKAFIPYLLLAAIAGGGYLWHLGDEAARPKTHFRSQGEAQIGGPFSLTDQNGAQRSDIDFRGRYMLVFFGFTNCPDVCPTTLAMLSAIFDRLGAKADRVVPIFITIDPARDTSAVLKSYLASFGARFVGLTGTDAQVAAAARAYRVYYKKEPLDGGGYTMDHSSVIYLMGPDGKFVTYYEVENGPDALVADLGKRL